MFYYLNRSCYVIYITICEKIEELSVFKSENLLPNVSLLTSSYLKLTQLHFKFS